MNLRGLDNGNAGLGSGFLGLRFLTYFLPVALLGGGLLLYLFNRDMAHYAEQISANERLQLSLAGRSVVRDLESVIPDIDLLIASLSLGTFAESQSDVSRDMLLDEWQTFLRQKRRYHRLRLISTEGSELLRVERDGQERIRVVPDAELQLKRHRYYFQEAIGLAPGDVYISPIDLEMEHGQVVEPHVPLIRFAIPIFNAQMRQEGVFVLSYRVARMIGHFDEMLGGSRGHVSLLNSDGYWLHASQQHEPEWGFMFGSERTYARVHPEAWTKIQQNEQGQFTSGGSLYTYRTLYPLEVIGSYKSQYNGALHNADSTR